MNNFKQDFERISNELPFVFGHVNTNKYKMCKRNIKNNIKDGYIWDSYKPKTYKQYCDDKGIILKNTKTKQINKIYREYKTYLNEFYQQYKINENKFNIIQMFNMICNLLNKKENIKEECWHEDENYDLGLE